MNGRLRLDIAESVVQFVSTDSRTFMSSSVVNTKPRLFQVAFVTASSVEHSSRMGSSRHLCRSQHSVRIGC